MKKSLFALFVAPIVLVASQAVSAVMLFDVTSVSGTGANQTAIGTSNGVGWTMSETFISSGGLSPVLDQSYTGFSNAAFFNPPVAATDRLHIFSDDLTLSFDEPISSIQFYLRENGGTATLDFGIPYTLISGEIAAIGATGARPSTNGGIIQFDFLTPVTMLDHTTVIFDGLDAAWFVTAVASRVNGVPEPTTLALLGFAVAGLGFAAKRRRQP